MALMSAESLFWFCVAGFVFFWLGWCVKDYKKITRENTKTGCTEEGYHAECSHFPQNFPSNDTVDRDIELLSKKVMKEIDDSEMNAESS